MAFDALSFLMDYRIPYWTEGKNCQDGWVNITCPFCDDKSNHGGFNLSSNYYSCWKCGRKNIFTILKVLLGNTQNIKSIIEKYSDSNIKINIKKKLNSKNKINKIILPGDELNKNHKKYLKKRGFDPQYLIDKYDLLGTDFLADYGWKFRIIIPIYHYNKLVTYQGRDITNKTDLRYNTLSIDKSIMNIKDTLYGLKFCKNTDKIGVVEGVFDKFKIGDSFVSSFGTEITEKQIKLLSYFDNIFFLFDPERSALNKSEKAADKLAVLGKNVEIVDIEKDYDIGDCTFDEINVIRKELGFEK